MKKIIKITLISFITLFSVNSFSQGNLKFNRVRLESYQRIISSYTETYDTIFVSAGKVLKITSLSVLNRESNTSDHFYTNTTMRVYIDDIFLCCGPYPAEYPIWLNEGSHILRFYQNSNTTRDIKFSFSGIEFNVVP